MGQRQVQKDFGLVVMQYSTLLAQLLRARHFEVIAQIRTAFSPSSPDIVVPLFLEGLGIRLGSRIQIHSSYQLQLFLGQYQAILSLFSVLLQPFSAHLKHGRQKEK